MIHILKILVALAALSLQATSAWAIDCSKAKTKLELAICASPALLEKDRQMNQAYAKSAALRSPEQKKLLIASQKQWLKALESEVTEHGDYVAIDMAIDVRVRELEAPINDIAVDLVSRIQKVHSMLLGKRWTDERLDDYGFTWINDKSGRNQIEAIVPILEGRMLEKDLAANFLKALNGSHNKYVEALELNEDGVDDFAIAMIEGTIKETQYIFIASAPDSPGMYRFLPITVNTTENPGGNDAEYVRVSKFNGRTIIVRVERTSRGHNYDFYDVSANPVTGSRLQVKTKIRYNLDTEFSRCPVPGCGELIGDVNLQIDPDGYAVEGLRGVGALKSKKANAQVQKAAIAKLKDAFELSENRRFEALWLDIDNDGDDELLGIVDDGTAGLKQLQYVDDPSGNWSDIAPMRVVDLGKDFAGFDPAKIQGEDSSYSMWGYGAELLVLKDREGAVHLKRIGPAKFNNSNWLCCKIQIYKIENGQVRTEFTSDISQEDIFASAMADGVSGDVRLGTLEPYEGP